MQWFLTERNLLILTFLEGTFTGIVFKCIWIFDQIKVLEFRETHLLHFISSFFWLFSWCLIEVKINVGVIQRRVFFSHGEKMFFQCIRWKVIHKTVCSRNTYQVLRTRKDQAIFVWFIYLFIKSKIDKSDSRSCLLPTVLPGYISPKIAKRVPSLPQSPTLSLWPTGIMGLQWAKHLGKAVKVTITDISETCVKMIKENCQLNNIRVEGGSRSSRGPDAASADVEPIATVEVAKMDANVIMHLRPFDYMWVWASVF